jgi:hypothetical protein
MDLAQSDPDKVTDILKWRGHPDDNDLGNRRIPWLSSPLEGIVTNSFLSGEDYAGDHRPAPRDWWVGGVRPEYSQNAGVYPDDHDCGTLSAISNALCDDWIVYVNPEPEYRFMLAATQRPPVVKLSPTADNGLGNFNDEHMGNLENETEQWMIPGGFRPEPGDRIYMTGRWSVDCGHDEWHAELHPIESFVTSHMARGRDGNFYVVDRVVVTPDWSGETFEFDVWPPARPTATATLNWKRENCCFNTGGFGIGLHVSLIETVEPHDNPNHVHVMVRSTIPPGPLRTDELNDVYPGTSASHDPNVQTIRELATMYTLSWVIPNPNARSTRPIQ